METKLGYIIAAYFGKRRFVHPKQLQDNFFYVKTQLEQISKLNTKPERIYIVCTFDEVINKDSILSELYQLKQERNDIIIITRENIGGSYCGWYTALDIDNGYCDYVILQEDDYTIWDPNSVTYLLEYFKEEPNLFYLCQMWTTYPLTINNITVPNHAGISNGIINNKLYQELQSNGMDFTLIYDSDTLAYATVTYLNQLQFLEQYRKNGILIKDYREKYSSLFAHHQNQIEECGNRAGNIIFIPIVDAYFK